MEKLLPMRIGIETLDRRFLFADFCKECIHFTVESLPHQPQGKRSESAG
jgi:hypothetical protein